ncbi:nicotinamide-nucleotide adenylyltransferase [Candidatus Micrarchaeota archaeon]|nr:nicotinamide-nucleotide adenylyltransferase [Candidatus Micrarchaeota archaeon]
MGTGLIIGRFQPVHNGHMQAIQTILKHHDRVVIIVGSAQESRTSLNPFSIAERRAMLDCAMAEITPNKMIRIMALEDQGIHAEWIEKVREGVPNADTVYSSNPLVERLLKPFMHVKAMTSNVDINATKIREWMKQGNDEWREYVPKSVQSYLDEHELIDVVRSL